MASIDFPDPGGPIIKILCPPEAANSTALFTKCCPITSEKSKCFLACLKLFLIDLLAVKFLDFNFSSNSFKFDIGITSIPFKNNASSSFSFGIIIPFNPISLAFRAIGKIPFTGLMAPSSDNSPIIK